MYKKIMVGTDGSNASEKAVDHAIELCKNVGAELLVVSVVDLESVSGIEQTDEEVYRRVQSDLEKMPAKFSIKLKKRRIKKMCPLRR